MTSPPLPSSNATSLASPTCLRGRRPVARGVDAAFRRAVGARVLLLAVAAMVLACGGPKSASPAASPPGAAPAASTAAGPTDAGVDAEAASFAGSIAEATSMISAAIESRQSDIGRCVQDFRVRKKLAHALVAVQFGIDQEGRLLGVTSKGKEDTELKTCVHDVLRTAKFPRSRAGIITVTKSYEEIVR